MEWNDVNLEDDHAVLGDAVMLVKDPQLVCVPLFDEQVCEVFAHSWDVSDREVNFFVATSTGGDQLRTETVRLPRQLLASDSVLNGALFDYGALASPVGSKTLLHANDIEPHVVKTVVGCPVMVWADLWSLQGPNMTWKVIVQGYPQNSRPVMVPMLRFPVSLLTSDLVDNTTRNW